MSNIRPGAYKISSFASIPMLFLYDARCLHIRCFPKPPGRYAAASSSDPASLLERVAYVNQSRTSLAMICVNPPLQVKGPRMLLHGLARMPGYGQEALRVPNPNNATGIDSSNNEAWATTKDSERKVLTVWKHLTSDMAKLRFREF